MGCLAGGGQTHDHCLVLVWQPALSGISEVRSHVTTGTGGVLPTQKARCSVLALIALLLILAIFGGLGFAVHALWIILVVALVLWLLGFFLGGAVDGGRRGWYGR